MNISHGANPPAPPAKDKDQNRPRPDAGPRGQPPLRPSHPRTQYAPTPTPMIDLLLDDSLIPTLPPPGGSLTRQDLMGKPKLPLFNIGVTVAPPARSSSSSTITATLPVRGSGRPLNAPAPEGVRRSSSVQERTGGNQAGIGAGVVGNGSGNGNGNRQGRRINPSNGNGRKGNTSRGVMDVVTSQRHKPGMIRRTSSFELPVKTHMYGDTPATVANAVEVKRKHGRTASESTINDLPQHEKETLLPPPRSTSIANRSSSSAQPPQQETPERSTSLDRPRPDTYTGLRLGTASDRETVGQILKTLRALTPDSRITTPPPPPASSGTLDPLSLIIPTAIILEALVCEREVLKGPSENSTTLPTLRDGSRLQLVDGELDWKVVRSYILAIGITIDSILPILRDHPSTNEEDEDTIRDLTKSIRAYVGKMKKVFGEVAAMYMDQYGFMRGWWDQSGMRSAAGEIGRWGDLFDA
ncbi:hypothetical protein IAR55_004117 [Kwoniella newhampshirensis]|uniref:Uncharacterized protein n=1 Tax=Kwoniella newhampshirensis TaxID=1651941 RepID=A0AAW0YLR6_9TREE